MKKEILTQLQELRSGISVVDLDTLQSKKDQENPDRIALGEKIGEQIRVLEADIATLEEKVKDDTNYSLSFSAFQFQYDAIQRQINTTNQSIAQNVGRKIVLEGRKTSIPKEIAQASTLIDKVEGQIRQYGLQRKRIAALLEQANKGPLTATEAVALEVGIDNLEKVYKIRDLSEIQQKNDDMIANLERQRNELQQRRSQLEQEISDIDSELERISLQEVSLNERLARQTKISEGFEQQLKSGDMVDLVTQEQDMQVIEQKRALIRSLSRQRNDYLYNVSGELSTLVDRYRKNTISEEELLIRLQEFKDRLPADFFVNGYKKREKELARNRDIQKRYSEEIAQLETKLQNSDNYTVSELVIERDEGRLIAYTGRWNASKYQLQLARDTYDNLSFSVQDLSARLQEEYGYHSRMEDELYRQQQYMKEVDLTSARGKAIVARIRSLQDSMKESEKLQREMEKEYFDNQQQLSASKASVKQLESRTKRWEQQVMAFEKRIHSKDIDKSAKKQDERRLAEAEMAMAALQTEEAFLQQNPRIQLNDLLSKLGKEVVRGRKQKDEETVVETTPLSPKNKDLGDKPEQPQKPAQGPKDKDDKKAEDTHPKPEPTVYDYELYREKGLFKGAKAVFRRARESFIAKAKDPVTKAATIRTESIFWGAFTRLIGRHFEVGDAIKEKKNEQVAAQQAQRTAISDRVKPLMDEAKATGKAERKAKKEEQRAKEAERIEKAKQKEIKHGGLPEDILDAEYEVIDDKKGSDVVTFAPQVEVQIPNKYTSLTARQELIQKGSGELSPQPAPVVKPVQDEVVEQISLTPKAQQVQELTQLRETALQTGQVLQGEVIDGEKHHKTR